MITHGNKQISEIVYARKASEGGGAVLLTNIIRGAQVVFGGLKPSFGWLTGATVAAILAAFGQTNGNAVIKATNVYLNAIAATDPTKAFALAAVLNANPQNAVMAKYVADYGDNFAHMVLDLGMTTFEVPIVAADTNIDSKKMWLIRSGQGYTNWNNIDNLMSQTDWQYLLGGFSSGNVGGNTYCTLCGTKMTAPRTLLRFFVPTSMPTGYVAQDADAVVIYVNGTKVFSGTHRNRTSVTYDFSNIIELNKPNFVTIAWRGSGLHGEDFGFAI